MPFYTPLRYPGGKRRLAPFIMRVLEANDLRDVQYAEPYAGGAAVALALLFEGYAAAIHINDRSRAVFAFWHAAVQETEAFCRKIRATAITTEEWKRQRAIYEDHANADLFDLGFAAFFLNRTNRSGIIAGGMIGGKGQTGALSLDARFPKDTLVPRIERIGRYRDRIHLTNQDALAFTDNVVSNLNGPAFAFYDPPYLSRGKGLYLNEYTPDDHQKVARHVCALKQPWVVTYDHEGAMRHRLTPIHPI